MNETANSGSWYAQVRVILSPTKPQAVHPDDGRSTAKERPESRPRGNTWSSVKGPKIQLGFRAWHLAPKDWGFLQGYSVAHRVYHIVFV